MHLDLFLQAYAVEMAKLEARKQGYSAYEQPLSDGSIKVTLPDTKVLSEPRVEALIDSGHKELACSPK